MSNNISATINLNLQKELESIKSSHDPVEALNHIVCCLRNSRNSGSVDLGVAHISHVVNTLFSKFHIPEMKLTDDEIGHWNEAILEERRLSVLVADKIKSSVFNRFQDVCPLVNRNGDICEYSQDGLPNLIVDWRELTSYLNKI